MYILELKILNLLANYKINNYSIVEIKISKDSPYFKYLKYEYPKSNIKEINDNFNRTYDFYITNKMGDLYIYLILNNKSLTVLVEELFIVIDGKKNLYEFEIDIAKYYYKQYIGNDLYSNQVVEGYSEYFYLINPANIVELSDIIGYLEKSGNIEKYDEEYYKFTGSSYFFVKRDNQISIQQDSQYRIEMTYIKQQDYGFPLLIGGKRYGYVHKRILSGFSNFINYPLDVWNQKKDISIFGIETYRGSFRKGVFNSDTSWGNGSNLTKDYCFGATLNYGDTLNNQIVYSKEYQIYKVDSVFFNGLHFYKSDTSNNYIKQTYEITNEYKKSLVIHFDFTIMDKFLNNLTIGFVSQNTNAIINLNISRVLNINIDNLYRIHMFDTINLIDYEENIIIPFEDFTVDMQILETKIILYIDNQIITVLDTNISLKNVFVQQGIPNNYTDITHFILNKIEQMEFYDDIYNNNFTNLVIPNITFQIPNSNQFIYKINRKIKANLPVKLIQQQSVYPYYYDFDHIVGEDYLIDLQHKNFMLKYTMRVSILDKMFSNLVNIDNIEDFLWRQTTPFYIREQVYLKDNFIYSAFVHTLQNIIQRLNDLQKRYGDVFDIYSQDLYVKRTFYLYINDIGILQDYLSGIEFNKQIYMLLSINFYKHIMYYTEYRGVYSCIDKILNDQFLNIAGLVQLYVFIFRKLRDIKLYEFTTQKKLINFKNFLNNNGYNTVFQKQKSYQYYMYEPIIGLIKNNIYIKLKYYKRIQSMSLLESIIESEIDKYLQSSVYRGIIIVYDDYLIKSQNLEEQIKTFFDFIKKYYLPQNIEIIYIKLSELNINLSEIQNKNNNINDFGNFEFNTFNDFYSQINSLLASDSINNGRCDSI